MFERFTEQARRTLFFARYEASQLGGLAIETEHLLLGLTRNRKGLTGHLFTRLGVPIATIRLEVEGRSLFRERVSTSVEIPFSEQTKRVLDYAGEEADRLRHNYIGTEHLLLGMLREERSVAATVLMEKGMRLEAVRQEIMTLLNENPAMEVELNENPSIEMEVDSLTRLAEENAQLRAVIRELEQGHDLPLQFHDNAYWLHREGQTPEGPYCSTCWDIDRRLVRKLSADDGDMYCEYCTHHRPKF
jgi:ATP-dependent Clp protease ATP-binding subunit ClpC